MTLRNDRPLSDISVPSGDSATATTITESKPAIERVQALADVLRSRYVIIATKPVHGLQIRPTSHNCGVAAWRSGNIVGRIITKLLYVGPG